MKKMMLAAIAALSLGVGSAYAAQNANQAPGAQTTIPQNQSIAGGAG